MTALFMRRRLQRVAGLLAEAWVEPHGWQWNRFDAIVSEEAGLVVQTMVTEGLSSGAVGGAAIRNEAGTVGVLVVPKSVSLEHQIHVAAHEAWHLIAGHCDCTDGPGEREAELFAQTVGVVVGTRRRPASCRWYRLVGVV